MAQWFLPHYVTISVKRSTPISHADAEECAIFRGANPFALHSTRQLYRGVRPSPQFEAMAHLAHDSQGREETN